MARAGRARTLRCLVAFEPLSVEGDHRLAATPSLTAGPLPGTRVVWRDEPLVVLTRASVGHRSREASEGACPVRVCCLARPLTETATTGGKR